MSDGFNSGDWYRIADAKPALQRDVEISRHVYLGRPWYVLTDSTGGKVHRLTPAAYAVAGRFDGQTSLDQIWCDTVSEHGTDAPTQDEVIRLISQLHSSDLLSGTDRPLLDELVGRRDKERSQGLKKILLNPLAATFPLIDPNRFLGWLTNGMSILPRAAWWGLAIALIGSALFVLPVHLPALLDRGFEGFLDLENLFVVLLIYPVVKVIHEIGHGVTICSRGGEVHEMGVMMIAFYPIPYVEASASLAFPSKWDRAAVAAAGVMVELSIAALALFVWIDAEPGLLRSIAYNTLLISGFSTLMVNGNPLMKFDGYHVFCDVIEIPNLSKRGNEWWGEVLRTRVLGTRERNRLPRPLWERFWFTVYPPAAFVYRIGIALSIALFVATTYRAVGIVLAIWSLTLTIVWPAVKVVRSTVNDQRIAQAGRRALVGGSVAAAAILGLLFVPAPFRTINQGVVWLPTEAIVRARSPGFITDIFIDNGAQVAPGTQLFHLNAPYLEADLTQRQARLQQLRGQYAAARFTDRARAISMEAAVTAAERSVIDIEDRVRDLTIKAGVGGTVDIPALEDSRGRYLREGEIAGFVLPEGRRLVRVVVPQGDIDLVRNRLRSIEMRVADHPGKVFSGEIVREVPAAAAELPSAALSLEGGGPFATIPTQDNSLQTMDRLFQFDLAFIDGPQWPVPFGMRIFVRFEIEPTPLAFQIGRKIRMTFLTFFEA